MQAMHLVHLYIENARYNALRELNLKQGRSYIAKWALLPAGKEGLDLLRLFAAGCAGIRLFNRFPHALQGLCRNPDLPVQVEFVLALYPPYEFRQPGAACWGSGVQIDRAGNILALHRKASRFLDHDIPLHQPRKGIGGSWLFVLGYGPDAAAHAGTDDFDFTDPFFRITRFHSLFLKHAPLTDPVEFLTRMHYRAIRCKRLAPAHVLALLSKLLRSEMDIDTGSWMSPACDFNQQWEKLRSWQRRMILPIIDMARHLSCAFPRSAAPLNTPSLVLFNRPDLICPEKLFPRWVRLMDRLLPQTQFIVTLGERGQLTLPEEALKKKCMLPRGTPETKKQKHKKETKLQRPGTILLLDVDSRLPNVALMKLSRHFKELGRQVLLARHDAFLTGADAVYASCVFNRASSFRRLERLRKYYGESLVVGGSGVNLTERLPWEIESLPADYSLYPELGKDCAIGFLTRGCPYHCPFCVVPIKEGAARQVCDLGTLMGNGRRNLILLDDNILAHPCAGNLLEDMARRDLRVNFTQTLDLRLLDQAKVRLLKRIQCSNLRFSRRVMHFSLNDCRNLDTVRRSYEKFGFTTRDNVEFICMYGFNTTLAEDVERFRFLRSLPGAYVFVQEYMPYPGGPAPDLANFFDKSADSRIDELIGILYPQNMKSMEKYYRWVSRQYVKYFGRLHQGLVDTIFRYNHRQRRGDYMAQITTV